MKVAIIGRNEILYDVSKHLLKNGHKITFVITSKHAPEYLKTQEDFEDLAKELEVDFCVGSNINEFRDIIKINKADIAVSMNYTGIIPQSIIDLFNHGILNIHPGDLPRYRGNACLAWAIINAEKKCGLCVHKMIGDELDSGNIITREYLNLNLNTKILDAWNWVNERAPSMVLKAISLLEVNSNYFLEKQSNKKEDILRCYPRMPEDGQINWNKNCFEILRLINASGKPYKGAFCFLNNIKVTIWDAKISNDNENFFAIPGQVTSKTKEHIEVACGEGKLLIKEIEVNGSIINPNQIINSIRTRFK